MRLRIGWLAICLTIVLIAPALPAHAQAGALYFPATGHHLVDNYGFLSFWRAREGERLLGFPVTEALSIDGTAVQYFERGRLEQSIGPDGAALVRSGRVAAEYAEALWRTFPPAPPRRAVAGEQRFENGYALREPFLGFWQAAGGLEFFGPPISEPLWEQTEQGQRQVQYFERARLERDASLAGTPGEIQVSGLGRALALLHGLNLAPVPNWGAEIYGPPAPLAPDVAPLNAPPPLAPAPAAAPAAAASPAPTPAPARPRAPRPASSRLIVVNLSEQWLYAFEGGAQVFDAPVSTGRDGMNTPAGSYAVYAKIELQTMRGVTDGVPWVVPSVPDVMYFNGGVALHGTYWHNQFGTGARLSHGCVNLPLKAAAWLFNWASIGTPVRVTY